ncbi:MAG: bifunctional proline dehydrogenase/L-glutamate gamma-semialdehyde dehydrogenase [Desulfobulbus sp.]|nr:bifunctional proline dehydrogenase/L-glutamate gamma-semialdehyde dehydrogenase [Desulfobulbus sp.]
MRDHDPLIIDQAVALAAQWQNRANELLTRAERDYQRRLQRLMANPGDKVLLSRMIDQSFRPDSHLRVADQLRNLLRRHGTPLCLTAPERLALRLFTALPPHLTASVVALLIRAMRSGASQVILPGEMDRLHAHLRRRHQEGVRMNINHLGEAVLGEDEAARRLATYIRDMADPQIECISIKISTLYSQISSLAFGQTVDLLKERLTAIYRAAKKHGANRPDTSVGAKFVNLDMEEYRDLEITYQVFTATLDQEEFLDLSAGIVLQAYLPDSFAIQQELTAWAQRRQARGGAPIKLRIVKGANMEMEKLEAALNNWPQAPYDTKLEVDANFKQMIAFGMQPENISAVHLGIASHNLFDLAYAGILAKTNGVESLFCYEMLEGMADHVRRAIQESGTDLLLYAPVAARDEFINAVAYLIRRLDENTAPENFLRFAPHLRVGSPQWKMLETGFRRSCITSVRTTPNRTQNRAAETFEMQEPPAPRSFFVNEPDTDWALAANRRWAEAIRNRWQNMPEENLVFAPLVINGEIISKDRPLVECHDPSRPGVLVGRYVLGSGEDAREALSAAAADEDGWRRLTGHERHRVLSQAAIALRAARADLIGTAMAETGKICTEADIEVSEAIDFTEFYPWAASGLATLPNVQLQGQGTVLVIAPWNFPIAIPCGGIAAALAAGNTVIFKPSSDAVLTGYHLCRCFWQAGVSQKTLQFLPCSGADVAPVLTGDKRVSAIILTGGTDTGLRILAQSPGVYLAAETGGKNATIVTDMADRDQAIKNVLHSAFSNSGQKCSATSLLILEKSVYDDSRFRRQLVDAAASIRVGSAWDFATRLGPLIRPPADELLRGLTSLEPGEEWALTPAMINGNPQLWSPGIKYGVRPGSFTHLTELFGPVLGVMRAETLNEAISLANQTGYGLTSGLESLDTREQEIWKAGIRAGNLYINRSTTGAIVLRQPFGGMGKSALGPGLKAGSIEYVSQFMQITETDPPLMKPLTSEHRLFVITQEWRRLLRWGAWPAYRKELEQTIRAVTSYLHSMETYYGTTQDYFHLRGQENQLRWLPVKDLVIRLHPDDSLFNMLARCAAALIAGCTPALSLPPGLTNLVSGFLTEQQAHRFLHGVSLVTETDEQLAERISNLERLRYGGPDRVPVAVYTAAARTGTWIARSPVCMEGRFELLHYLRQQAICNNYHRYGNLGERAID